LLTSKPESFTFKLQLLMNLAQILSNKETDMTYAGIFILIVAISFGSYLIFMLVDSITYSSDAGFELEVDSYLLSWYYVKTAPQLDLEPGFKKRYNPVMALYFLHDQGSLIPKKWLSKRKRRKFLEEVRKHDWYSKI
jgi:hypothetical protein